MQPIVPPFHEPTDREKIDAELKERAIRDTGILDFLAAHSRPNSHAWTGFLKSNLFAGIALWILTQSAVLVGTFVAFNYRVSALSEWKGNVDSTLKRMDEVGTTHSHFADERQDTVITELKTKVNRMEDDSRQFEVIKAEHRRLTADVEELKHGKK